ncbi:MAG: hypothetical protein ACYDEX_13500 [Mobilitalea sp.]
MKSKKNQEIHVHCPYCSNKRLFDCTVPAEGIIKIKCPSCRTILAINLQIVSMHQQKKRLMSYQKINNYTTNIATEPHISMEI